MGAYGRTPDDGGKQAVSDVEHMVAAPGSDLHEMCADLQRKVNTAIVDAPFPPPTSLIIAAQGLGTLLQCIGGTKQHQEVVLDKMIELMRAQWDGTADAMGAEIAEEIPPRSKMQ